MLFSSICDVSLATTLSSSSSFVPPCKDIDLEKKIPIKQLKKNCAIITNFTQCWFFLWSMLPNFSKLQWTWWTLSWFHYTTMCYYYCVWKKQQLLGCGNDNAAKKTTILRYFKSSRKKWALYYFVNFEAKRSRKAVWLHPWLSIWSFLTIIFSCITYSTITMSSNMQVCLKVLHEVNAKYLWPMTHLIWY